MKQIPYSHQCIDKDDIEEVIKVLKSDWITQGPKVKEFEDALCRYTGARYAVVVSSGTAALHIACLAAGIKSGDKVITSPITFIASANCILYCGGKLVFVDIQPDTANIDPDKIENYLTSHNSELRTRPKAIIPVHFAGQPCDMLQIHRIAKKYNLIVIEDASHALGAEYKGGKIGNCQYSEMTIFSFHPVKSITTGEGGAVLTNNKELYEKLLILRTHGITKNADKFINKKSAFFPIPRIRSTAKNLANLFGVYPDTPIPNPWYYEMQLLGYNYRLTDIQCALGISQLKKLEKFIEKRRRIVEIYRKYFKDNEYFDLPQEKDYAKSSWHLYPIRLKDAYKKKKKKIFQKLREKGLGVQVHYIPVYWQPYYQSLGYKKGTCPHAEDFYHREISIPLYQSMDHKNVKWVVNTILEVCKSIQRKCDR